MWHVSPNHPISASSARVADICCALSSVDRCKDRLQQRAGIGGRARVAPETGQIGRGAQFEEPGFLLAGDLDGFQEASFRARSIQRGKRNSPLDAMQVGQPEALS
jgi:hypothetical protein